MAESNNPQSETQAQALEVLPQSPTAGVLKPWAPEVQIQALLAVQCLEQQRLHLRPHGARHRWATLE